MKQLIKDVLDDMSTGQINLSSTGARELIATTVAAVLKSNGTYLKDSEMDKQMAREREKWVCSICGENTFDVDYDYIGSDTNHLGCELEHEKRVSSDRRQGDRREKNFSQKKHEDKVFNHQLTNDREYPYNSFVRNKEEADKLAEEIVSDNDTGYIYESPDGGKTVYKRKEGSDKREVVKDWKKINVRK